MTLRFSISLLWILYLSSFIVERRKYAVLQGRPVAHLTSFGTFPSIQCQKLSGTLSFISDPSNITHCFCQGWGQADISAVYCLAQFGGGDITEPRHTVMLWVIPEPLPLPLSATPDFEPVLKLFLSCEEKPLCSCYSSRFPISVQSELFQGFLKCP